MTIARALASLCLALGALPADAQQQFQELDTPYVPTPQAVVDRMLDLARLEPGETVIDLGSGDGRIMIEAAKRYGARGFGVEIDPRLVERSNGAAAKAGVAGRVKFLRQDLFKTDFHEANVLTLYLLPDVNLALRSKILAELRPGARVVSHDYGMGDWRPDASETVAAPDKTVGARKESQVFLWTVPAKVEGRWRLELEAGGTTLRMDLSLVQRYQYLSGSVTVPGRGSASLEGRLRGEEIDWVLPQGVAGPAPLRLAGRVSGNPATNMAGKIQGAAGIWSARR